MPLIAPTTTDERIKYLASAASSFIYTVSVTGVTGSGQGIPKDLGALIGRVRAQTDLPLAVGFGITSAETVKEVAAVADAVVVGSAILNTVDKVDSAAPPAERAAALKAYVAELKVRYTSRSLVVTCTYASHNIEKLYTPVSRDVTPQPQPQRRSRASPIE